MQNHRPSKNPQFAFVPPKINSFCLNLANVIYPLFLKLRFGAFSIEVVSGIQSVKALGTNRVILCPNHSSIMDIEMVFEIARLLNEKLYYLTARELFTGVRHFLQLFGCFSVLRGTNDFKSLKQSVKILQSGSHKLLVFPEGEISGQNNLLLPLKTGPAYIACSAIDHNKSLGQEDAVYVVPIAIRYTYPRIKIDFLTRSLNSIESVLGISASEEQSLQSRILYASEFILQELLYKHNLTNQHHGSFSERVDWSRRALMKRLANYVSYDLPENADEVELAHRLYQHLRTSRLFEQKLEDTLDYPSHHERYRLLNSLLHDLHRVINFIAVGKLSLGENQDDLINAIMLLKREVLPHQKWRMPMHLMISFGAPILINGYHSAGSKNHLEEILAITAKITFDLNALLLNLIKTNGTLRDK